MEGPREQGLVKKQLEIVEVENHYLILTDTLYIVYWLWNVPVWHNRNDWNLKPVKIGE